MKQPRVLVLLKTLGIGGAETLVLNSSRLWDRSQFDYRLGYLGKPADLEPEFRSGGFEPVRFAPSGHANDPFSLWELFRWIRREQIALIHAHLPVPSLWAALAARGTGTKVVATNHSQPEAMRPLTARIARIAWPRADLVIAVGSSLAADSRTARRTEVVNNGVELDRFVSARPAALDGIPPDATVVLVLGSLIGRKRPLETLSVFERAVEKAGSSANAHLVFAGGGELAASLAAARDASPHARRVHLLGLRRDIPALCARADIVLLLSRAEGLPMALLEGGAGGCALVATRVAAVETLVRDGKNGFLVTNDLEAADALSRLLADPALREKMGAASRETVAREFNLQSNVRRIEQLYREVLA